jgi:hypothetical protein
MNEPSVPIKNLDAFLSFVGQWNLYDMEIRALRFRADSPKNATLEADFYLDATAVRQPVTGTPRTEYEFVFRFLGVETLDMMSFGTQNVVGEYEFEPAKLERGQQGIRVAISGTVGGDLSLTCRSIEVVSAREVSLPGAA